MTTTIIGVRKSPGSRDAIEVPVDRDVLVAHLTAHHTQIPTAHRATKILVRDHGTRRHRYSPDHRHAGVLDPTRPAGPSNRPVGWYTGTDTVTREEDDRAFRARWAAHKLKEIR